MPTIPHSIGPVLLAYAAPLAALAVALGGAVLCRGKTHRGWLPAVAALAALAGWALLVPMASLPRAGLSPRSGPEILLAPAAAATAAAALVAWRGGRLGRAAPVLLAIFVGWWLAQSPAGRPEFWRVWVAVAAVAAVLSRAVAAQPARGLACGLALWGGLLVAGAGPAWIAAALVGAAVSAGLLTAGGGVALPASAMAALLGGTDLAGGRLVRAGLDGIDLACFGAVVAPLLAGAVEARLGKRWGRAGPVVAALAGAAAGAGLAWVIRRLLRH